MNVLTASTNIPDPVWHSQTQNFRDGVGPGFYYSVESDLHLTRIKNEMRFRL